MKKQNAELANQKPLDSQASQLRDQLKHLEEEKNALLDYIEESVN